MVDVGDSDEEDVSGLKRVHIVAKRRKFNNDGGPRIKSSLVAHLRELRATAFNMDFILNPEPVLDIPLNQPHFTGNYHKLTKWSEYEFLQYRCDLWYPSFPLKSVLYGES